MGIIKIVFKSIIVTFAIIVQIIKYLLRSWLLIVGILVLVVLPMQYFNLYFTNAFNIFKYYDALEKENKFQFITIIITVIGFYIAYITISTTSKREKLIEIQIEMAKSLHIIIANMLAAINQTEQLCKDIIKTKCVLKTSEDENEIRFRLQWTHKTIIEFSDKPDRFLNLLNEFESVTMLNNAIYFANNLAKPIHHIKDSFREISSYALTFKPYINPADTGFLKYVLQIELDELEKIIYYCEEFRNYISLAGGCINSVLIAPIRRVSLHEILFMIKNPKLLFNFPELLTRKKSIDSEAFIQYYKKFFS